LNLLPSFGKAFLLTLLAAGALLPDVPPAFPKLFLDFAIDMLSAYFLKKPRRINNFKTPCPNNYFCTAPWCRGQAFRDNRGLFNEF
jgi:hypothetical protein